MDGQFVATRSFGPDKLQTLHLPKHSTAHLMVKRPREWIAACRKAHIRRIVVHGESRITPSLLRVLRKTFTVLIAINPGTPLTRLQTLWRLTDGIQVMMIHPGRQGAAFLSSQLAVVRKLHAQHPRLWIAVDGGMNFKTIPKAIAAGANEIVVGSVLKNSRNPRRAYAKILKLARGARQH